MGHFVEQDANQDKCYGGKEHGPFLETSCGQPDHPTWKSCVHCGKREEELKK